MATCSEHKRALELACLKCKKEICLNCLSKHKGAEHDAVTCEDLADMLIKYKNKEIEGLMKNSNEHRVEKIMKNIKQEFVNIQQKLFSHLEKCFNKGLKEKRNSCIEEVVKSKDNLHTLMEIWSRSNEASSALNDNNYGDNNQALEKELEAFLNKLQSFCKEMFASLEESKSIIKTKIKNENENFCESKIVSTKEEGSLLEQWVQQQLEPKLNFDLLYQGSRDGFKPGDYHSKCDGHGPLLVLARTENDQIIGGFTTVKCESPESEICSEDPKAFIFSLTKKKMISEQIHNKQCAFRNEKNYGPKFGYGVQLLFGYEDKPPNMKDSCQIFNSLQPTFNVPGGTAAFLLNIKNRSPNNFSVKELEVYQSKFF